MLTASIAVASAAEIFSSLHLIYSSTPNRALIDQNVKTEFPSHKKPPLVVRWDGYRMVDNAANTSSSCRKS